MIIAALVVVVVGGTLVALALARAAAIGDEANAFKRKRNRRNWWEW